MRLTDKSTTPPGGWRYIERSTGQSFEANSFVQLVEKVRPHREYKGLPLETLEHDIEEQLCLTLGTPPCIRGPNDPPQVNDRTHAVSPGMLLDFNRAVFAHIKEGAKWVELSESRRRAAICRTCPLNKNLSNCACTTFYRVVEKLVPVDLRDKDLGVCAACGCSLNAKVNLTEDVLRASANPENHFPSWCWQHEVLENTGNV